MHPFLGLMKFFEKIDLLCSLHFMNGRFLTYDEVGFHDTFSDAYIMFECFQLCPMKVQSENYNRTFEFYPQGENFRNVEATLAAQFASIKEENNDDAFAAGTITITLNKANVKPVCLAIEPEWTQDSVDNAEEDYKKTAKNKFKLLKEIINGSDTINKLKEDLPNISLQFKSDYDATIQNQTVKESVGDITPPTDMFCRIQ